MGHAHIVVIDHHRQRFYCWRWDRHFSWSKLNYCFNRACVGMCLPPALRWKTSGLGLPVPLPAGPGRGVARAS
jgi:hypothetical protein